RGRRGRGCKKPPATTGLRLRRGEVNPRDRRRQGGILPEDRALEVPKGEARLEPELLVEDAPGLARKLERVGLAAAPVEREHEQRPQPLAERIARHEARKLGDGGTTAPALDLGVEPLLRRPDPQLLERRPLPGHERQVELGERLAAPKALGLA